MEMGPYDMVFGTDWMRSVGPLNLYLNAYTLKFQRDGEEVKLDGIKRGKAKLNALAGKENINKSAAGP
jgi:hypothetical protein